MPRGPRLDAPGCLHHVMLRGIERRRIFFADDDRYDLLARLTRILPQAGMSCFAWAFMPNHVHLLVRTGPTPLARVMARVNTGYAQAFNQRHARVGYLFQGRYKSILVEREEYLLTLLRYVHLNPLHAGHVKSLSALGRHRWTGYATLMGNAEASFQDSQAILERFGGITPEGRRRLVEWMAAEHAPENDAPRFIWRAVKRVPRKEASPAERPLHRRRRRAREAHRLNPEWMLPELVARVCSERDVSTDEVRAASVRRRSVTDARAEIAYRACAELGLPATAVANALGLSKGTVSQARVRGRALIGPERRHADP
jgi:REP element-mobilizing transposase RayT